MSINYFRYEKLSRANKKNAVKYTAYILRQKMIDQQTGKQHNYSHGYGNIQPNEWGIIGWNNSAESLANTMESADNRKNSRVARTFVGALPHELSPEQHIYITQKIAQDLYDIDQAPLIFVIHRNTENNPHFYIIKSTRQSEDNINLHKKSRIWENIKTGPQICKKIREIYIQRVNEGLYHLGLALETYDKEHIPQIHMGPYISAKERKNPGSTTEGQFNMKVKKLRELEQRLKYIRQIKQKFIEEHQNKK